MIHLLLVVGSVLAANHYPDPVFLSKSAVSVSKSLTPPPARGSAEDKADFDRILKYQAERTAEECERAAFVVDVKLDTLFGPKNGPLTAAEVERWSNFFGKIRIDTDYFVQETKKHWGRLRPYLNDKRVEPCVHREVTKAYPSGHAAISRTFARILTKLDPSRAEAFDKRADEIAEHRVLAGVHHPTDIEAGKKLGDQVFEALIKNKAFVKSLETLAQ